MEETNVLSVRHLTTQFVSGRERVTAVNDLSFDIPKGKVLGIVGESGCGKSVTSLSIMRLIGFSGGIITGGEILLEGQNVLELSEAQMRKIRGNRISMIFQEPMTAFNPVFTIGYQLQEVLGLHMGMNAKEGHKKSIELLERVRIPRADKILDEYPHQLSGGMRQRIMIAMAIACNPTLLIADEPTTALDVTIQAQVLELMKELVREYGLSILFITHDLGVIAEMAQEVAVMYAGQIVEKAPVHAIFAEPAHPYTQGLLAARPSLAPRNSRLSCIPGMVPSLNELPKTGCMFCQRCGQAADLCGERTPSFIEIAPNHWARCLKKEAGEHA